MSADSSQRLKAQAAESGLHQSDSGLASKRNHLHCISKLIYIFVSVLQLPTMFLSTLSSQLMLVFEFSHLSPFSDVSSELQTLYQACLALLTNQGACASSVQHGSLALTIHNMTLWP